MLIKGIIVEITDYNEALIAYKSGVHAIMIIYKNKNNDMDIDLIKNIKQNIDIPLICKCDCGNFIQARLLEQLNVDYIFENIDTTNYFNIDSANYAHNENLTFERIDKKNFSKPFISSSNSFHKLLLYLSESTNIIFIGNDQNEDYKISLKQYRGIIQEIEKIKKDVNIISESKIEGLLNRYSYNNTEFEFELRKIIEKERIICPTFLTGNILSPLEISYIINSGLDGVVISNDIFKYKDVLTLLQLNCLVFNHPEDITKISQIHNISYPLLKNYDREEIDEDQNINNKSSQNEIENNIVLVLNLLTENINEITKNIEVNNLL